MNDEKRLKLLGEYWKNEAKWREAWGVVPTNYVHNDWISCAFVGGPHGWCHPDGTIGFCNNIGKWPSIEEVYSDWKQLAEIFPYIEVEATLMNGEECEDGTKPVVSFLIRNGKVTLVDPDNHNLHDEFGRQIMRSPDMVEELLDIFSGHSDEHAIELSQLKKWGDAFKLYHHEFFEN